MSDKVAAIIAAAIAAIAAIALLIKKGGAQPPPDVPPDEPCTPGDQRCVGHSLYMCNAEGNWVLEEEQSLECGWEPPPGPAEFQISDLTVQPSEVVVGEAVTVSVLLTNVGGSRGGTTVYYQVEGKNLTWGAKEHPAFVVPSESRVVSHVFSFKAAWVPRLPETFSVAVRVQGQTWEEGLHGSVDVSPITIPLPGTWLYEKLIGIRCVNLPTEAISWHISFHHLWSTYYVQSFGGGAARGEMAMIRLCDSNHDYLAPSFHPVSYMYWRKEESPEHIIVGPDGGWVTPQFAEWYTWKAMWDKETRARFESRAQFTLPEPGLYEYNYISHTITQIQGAYDLIVSPEPPTPPEPPEPPGPDQVIHLTQGPNTVIYAGKTMALPDALTNITDYVEIVWRHEATGEWLQFYLYHGTPMGNLTELVYGKEYVVTVTNNCEWYLEV